MDAVYNPHLPDARLQSNGQWVATCPQCGKKDHFYMNAVTGMFDCKRCGISGNFYKFTSITKGNYVFIDGNSRTDIMSVDNNLEKVVEEDDDTPLESVELPDGFKILGDEGTEKAMNYVISRRYSVEQCADLGFGYCDRGLFWNRLIMPIIMNGEMYGYLGRFIDIKGVKKVSKKYRNSFGMRSSKLIWGIDNVDGSDPVIICEGIFSAMRVWYNSVATFGKKLSQSQINLLLEKKVKEVVLLFDAAAESEIVKAADLCLDNGIQVWTLFFTEGDPDDSIVSELVYYQEIVKDAEPYWPKKYIY